MTDTETISAIVKYGLAVREIPLELFGVHEVRHYQEGDELIERYGRTMVRRRRVPKNAGHWMCQQVQNTNEHTSWKGLPNLAPTLHESIGKFLSQQHLTQ